MKLNSNPDGTPQHINNSKKDLTRVQRIVRILQEWERTGGTARAFAKAYNERLPEGEKPINHQTLIRWKDQYSGNQKSLYRKPRSAPKAEETALTSTTTNRDQQFEFMLGFIGSTLIDKKKVDDKVLAQLLNGATHVSLARAHELMLEVSSVAKWGDPMSIHMAYRRWEAILPAYRAIITKSKRQHYESIMVHLGKPKLAANQEWQMDEMEFKVLGYDRKTGKEKIITIYCVACVDTGTGFLRHIEVSERPIDKLTFIRALKRSLRGNREMGVPGCARPVNIRMDGASIHEKRKSKNPHKFMDVHLSASALNITLIHNKPRSPRMDAVVESFNGHFKDILVPQFIMFVRRIAPAMNAAEFVTHLLSLREQINAFGYEWNTKRQADGTSRLDKAETTLYPGTQDITEDEIDRGVRYTLSTPFNEAVQIDGDRYANPELFFRHRRRILVRVRPDGAGSDVEAYSHGEHVGTLYRVKDHPHMADGMDATCKAFIAEQITVGEVRTKRFCDLFEQLVFEGATGTPSQQEIVRAKRGLSAAPDASSLLTVEPEAPKAPADWKGGKL